MPEVHPHYPLDPHFAAQSAPKLTLEPLRQDGPLALSVHDLHGISKITLRSVEILWGNSLHNVTIWKSDDLFESTGATLPIPRTGTLVAASFDLQFQNMDRPTIVHIRPPFTLQTEPHCDTRLLFPWIDKRGFRATLSKVLALAALVLTTALPPVLDPDPDGDDDEHPHHHWSHTTR